MRVRFPAMQATIGQRTYYACVMKLSAIPMMFKFQDWIEFTPEDREQRVLNKKRVPDIARYVLDNEDGYIFSSITASYECDVKFEPLGGDGLGYLEMEFERANFVINDGQHRCAAIAQAIKENPALAEESISVLLFPYESRERVQQMFSDLNRFVVKTSRSLDILYDHRDTQSKITLEVCDRVDAFRGMVDKDAVHSLPARSEKMFSLAAVYDATDELLAERRNGRGVAVDELIAAAVDYWTAVARVMPDWAKAREGRIRPVELRQENISTHTIVLRAIGGLGAELTREFPNAWKERLAGLREVNWSKRNRDWENVCMVANSVVSNRQARVATKAYLKGKLGLALSSAEEFSVSRVRQGEPVPAAPAVRHLDPHSPVSLFYSQILSGHFAGQSVSNWSELIHCAMRTAVKQGVPFGFLNTVANVREVDPKDLSFHKVNGTDLWLQGMDANQCWRRAFALARKVKTDLMVHVRWKEKDGAAYPGEEAILEWSPARNGAQRN